MEWNNLPPPENKRSGSAAAAVKQSNFSEKKSSHPYLTLRSILSNSVFVALRRNSSCSDSLRLLGLGKAAVVVMLFDALNEGSICSIIT